MDTFLSLRRLLEGPPSRELFRFLLDAFAYWDEPDSLSIALDYAAQHLAAWDDSLRHAELRDVWDWQGTGESHPGLSLVRSLLLKAELEEDGWRACFSSGHLDHITHLSFDWMASLSYPALKDWFHGTLAPTLKGLSVEDAKEPLSESLLADCTALPALEAFDGDCKKQSVQDFLSRCSLPSLQALSCVSSQSALQDGLLNDLPFLKQLRRLELYYRADSLDGFRALVAASSSGSWESLSLRGSLYGSESGADLLTALADAPQAKALRSLTIRGCRLSAKGLATLASHPTFGQLKELTLDDGTFHTSDATTFANTIAMPHLRRLAIRGSVLLESSILALLRSSVAPQLERLSLAHTDWSEACSDAMLDASLLPQVQEFGLPSATKGLAPFLKRLASSPFLGQLRSLDLSHCQLPVASFEALVDSPHAERLQSLVLDRTQQPGLSFDQVGPIWWAAVTSPRLPLPQRRAYVIGREYAMWRRDCLSQGKLETALREAAKEAHAPQADTLDMPALLAYLPAIARSLPDAPVVLHQERRQERLDAYLEEPPSRPLFAAIWQLLQGWPEGASKERALALTEEALEPWDPMLRHADITECWPGAPASKPPAAFRLVRSLYVPNALSTDEHVISLLRQLDAPHLHALAFARPRFSSETLQALAKTSALSELRSLTLHAEQLDPFSAVALARTPHLKKLTRWRWEGVDEDRQLKALAASGLLLRATEIAISFQRWSEASFSTLQSLEQGGALKTLELESVGEGTLEALISSPLFSTVKHVTLSDCELPSEAIARLFAPERWSHVSSLSLIRDTQSDAILARLAAAPSPLGIEALLLHAGRLTPDGLTHLTSSPAFEKLVSLSFERCYRIDESEALARLFNSTHLASLETLSLDSVGSWEWAFVRSIKTRIGLPQLKHLHLISAFFNPEEIQLLLELYGESLETLEISRCNLKAKSISTLARMNSMKALRRLRLDGNESPKTGLQALARVSHWPHLVELRCEGNPGFDEALPAMVGSVNLSKEAKYTCLRAADHTRLTELATEFGLEAAEQHHKEELLAFLSRQHGAPSNKNTENNQSTNPQALEWQKKSKKELLAEAKQHLIPGRHKMNKDQLIEALLKRQGGGVWWL